MDIAVLSDIHGNYIALEKALSIALKRNITTFLFLGDYVGELPYPKKTMNILYKMRKNYNCYFIKGNKENYWLDYLNKGEQGWKENDSTTGCLLYTYSNLCKKDLEFFKQLSYVQEINIKGFLPITICHGSPNKVNEKMLPNDEKTFNIIKGNKSDYILCGHTHIQRKIEYLNKVVLNPGSIGVSLNSNGKAQFMILHGIKDKWSEEFLSINYDVHTIINELYESGLYDKAPSWCKITENLLLTGKVPHNKVLARAIELCDQDLGNCVWPNIPEKYWKEAINELI